MVYMCAIVGGVECNMQLIAVMWVRQFTHI